MKTKILQPPEWKTPWEKANQKENKAKQQQQKKNKHRIVTQMKEHRKQLNEVEIGNLQEE